MTLPAGTRIDRIVLQAGQPATRKRLREFTADEWEVDSIMESLALARRRGITLAVVLLAGRLRLLEPHKMEAVKA